VEKSFGGSSLCRGRPVVRFCDRFIGVYRITFDIGSMMMTFLVEAGEGEAVIVGEGYPLPSSRAALRPGDRESRVAKCNNA